MSSEITSPIIPQAPTLYGIDPTVTYKWVPSKFRDEFRDKAFVKFWEANKLDEKDEAERNIIIRRDFVEPLRGRRVAAKGSPWVEVGPLSSDLSLRLEIANSTYRRQLASANLETEDQIKAIQAKKIPAKRKADEIRLIERRAKDENVARGTAAYGSELIQEVLADAVRGWEGFRKPFVTWEESGQVMPPADQYELFWDIVNNNAWSSAEFESFESAPDSQQV